MLSAPPSFTRRRNEDVGRQDAQKMQADDDGKGGCEKEGAGLILFPADALGGGLKERRRASRGTKKKRQGEGAEGENAPAPCRLWKGDPGLRLGGLMLGAV